MASTAGEQHRGEKAADLRWRFLGFTLKLHLFPWGDGSSSGGTHLVQLPLWRRGWPVSSLGFSPGPVGFNKITLTSYLFWSSAAFLIHIIFSFFSMLLHVASMAFWAFDRSLYEHSHLQEPDLGNNLPPTCWCSCVPWTWPCSLRWRSAARFLAQSWGGLADGSGPPSPSSPTLLSARFPAVCISPKTDEQHWNKHLQYTCERGPRQPTFFLSGSSFHMRARSLVSSLSERSGRSCWSFGRFSSEKMNMAEIGRLGFSGLAYDWQDIAEKSENNNEHANLSDAASTWEMWCWGQLKGHLNRIWP